MLEIRIRNWSAIYLKIEFYRLLITVPLKCAGNLADQYGFWSVKCWNVVRKWPMTDCCLGNLLGWLRPFVGNHTKQIVIGSTYSSCSSVSSGVLRGSVLGHVLFLLCINVITTNINSQLCLLADDCLIYWLIALTADHQIPQTLCMAAWSRTWQMELNVRYFKCSPTVLIVK